MPADYDRSVLQEYADRLYRQAMVSIGLWTISGAMLGVFAGKIYGIAIRRDDLLLTLAIGGGLIGFLVGYRRSFWLKLEAQKTLCQMTTEQHLEFLVRMAKDKQ